MEEEGDSPRGLRLITQEEKKESLALSSSERREDETRGLEGNRGVEIMEEEEGGEIKSSYLR